MLCSCDQAVDAVGTSIPIGVWRRETIVNQGGVDRKSVRRVSLRSQSDGRFFDTLYTMSGTTWVVDSVWETGLTFQGVGDGYQRAVEIIAGMGSSDTSLSYWYFFQRNDSLYFYGGMRYLGSNPGIVGNWSSDPNDTAITRRYYTFKFGADSLDVTNSSGSGTPSGRYGYQLSGSTLTVTGAVLDFVNRYEVVPGGGLYLTTPLSPGYAESP